MFFFQEFKHVAHRLKVPNTNRERGSFSLLTNSYYLAEWQSKVSPFFRCQPLYTRISKCSNVVVCSVHVYRVILDILSGLNRRRWGGELFLLYFIHSCYPSRMCKPRSNTILRFRWAILEITRQNLLRNLVLCSVKNRPRPCLSPSKQKQEATSFRIFELVVFHRLPLCFTTVIRRFIHFFYLRAQY